MLTRPTDTDDDGSGLTGTTRNNAWLQATVFDTVDARWSRVTITATGSQNNLDITQADFVIFNNASDLTITGFLAPSSPAKPGKPFRYVCIGAGNVYFKHQNASSTAANRIIGLLTSGDTPHAAGVGAGMMVYDDSASRWRVVFHEQGDWIDYAATSTVTGWSSFATDGKHIWYYVRGREVLIRFYLEGTSNTTGASFTVLYAAGANGVSTLTAFWGPQAFPLSGVADSSSTVSAATHGNLPSSTSLVTLYKDMGGTGWTASGTKVVGGQFGYRTT